MGLIVYDGKTILDAKNKIDICNSEILEALEKIDNEFINMHSTLDTPKSRKKMPEFIAYYDNRIAFVRDNKDNYNNMFNTISGEYNNYMENVKKMVGDNNG